MKSDKALVKCTAHASQLAKMARKRVASVTESSSEAQPTCDRGSLPSLTVSVAKHASAGMSSVEVDLDRPLKASKASTPTLRTVTIQAPSPVEKSAIQDGSSHLNDQPRRARAIKRPERYNDTEDTLSEAIGMNSHGSDSDATTRTSPVTAPSMPVVARVTAHRPRPRPHDEATAAALPLQHELAPAPPASCSVSSDGGDEVEMFEFELDALPLAYEADMKQSGGRPELDRACELVYEKTEEEVMLDIMRGFEDEIGPDVRAVWDAAGKPEPIESSLLWDVVATPAMMRQLATHVRSSQVLDGSGASADHDED